MRILLLPLIALAPLAVDAAGQREVTVYRCTDASGHVALGDTPCARGTSEQVRILQRPVDAPVPAPATTAAPVAAPPPPAAAPPPPVVVRAPQPMYECVTPDGERYTSETAEGNPRWVPLWTLGYRHGGGHGPRPPRPAGNGALAAHYAQQPLWGRVGAPTPVPSSSAGGTLRPPPHRPPPLHAAGPGTWVRDACHALPQGEVCARLQDRRDVIRRRFFNAQEVERDTLRREERGINARLSADCAQ